MYTRHVQALRQSSSDTPVLCQRSHSAVQVLDVSLPPPALPVRHLPLTWDPVSHNWSWPARPIVSRRIESWIVPCGFFQRPLWPKEFWSECVGENLGSGSDNSSPHFECHPVGFPSYFHMCFFLTDSMARTTIPSLTSRQRI
jgi:hypothetical protein